MRFEEHVEDLGRRIGVELRIDEEGACALAVDDMTVTLQNVPETDSVGFWGVIGEPPPHDLEKLLLAMLEANHMFAGTGGATISRDHDTGQFYLCRVLDLRSLDADSFVAVLERFVNTLEAWIALVRDYRGAGSAELPERMPDAPDLLNGGFLAV